MINSCSLSQSRASPSAWYCPTCKISAARALRALNLNEDDALVDVRLTDGEQNILIATHEGRAICFDENEVRAMGRTATGVRGIRLSEGDYVVGAARARKGAYVLSITENGYGKRTPVEEFTIHHRGGGGMMLHNLTAKTGLVAGIAVVDNDNDVMIITDDGVIIRTGCEEIRECGRGSQGRYRDAHGRGRQGYLDRAHEQGGRGRSFL